ncbi:saccharopine dehydrogenase family protein [Legionella sp. D16C41]|uniref:saccharopine dehydrogenase family protein n=1 Tax=Legionella sp. D16C41 TaxID=3402688 RepID=UPI003AF5B82A
MNNWMIYGANGYTGELIAREAKARGLNPVIAGRNASKINSLAKELNLPSEVFDLLDEQEVKRQLNNMQLVLNCAGPFSATSQPMIKACIQTGTHYLDITGEISVFEYAYQQNLLAKAANIILCPGVGFDVIPTDCLAAQLKKALPDAHYLVLGFDSNSSLSPGTAKTAVEGLAQGGKVRIDGKIKTLPLAWKTRRINFGRGEKLATTIPWGDISTAYYTTGIPNIEVYIPMPAKRVSMLKRVNYLRWLLGLKPIQNFLKKKAAQQQGPNAEALNGVTYVWGEVKNAKGESKTATITTANGYALTVEGSLAVVLHLLEHPEESGYKTPSQLMGADFINKLTGSNKLKI